MQQAKIEDALTAALKHLEESISAHARNDENAMTSALWLASSEAEYVVFLLSFTQSDKGEVNPSKLGSSPKQPMEPEPILTHAQQLLKSAKTNAQAGDHGKSYEEAWTARNLLLTVQELLEKKRRQRGKR